MRYFLIVNGLKAFYIDIKTIENVKKGRVEFNGK